MPYLILLIFIVVPIAEIAVFIQVGSIIGLAPTLALIILTAIAGVWLLKRQGVAVLTEAREIIDAGGLPVQAVIDGVCLLLAGAFLLTPGLLTDTVGFLLLIPGFRRALARWIFAKLEKGGHISVTTMGTRAGAAPKHEPRRPEPGPIIEGEFEPIDEPAKGVSAGREGEDGTKPDPNSPWRRP